jgi:phosphoribosylglycinamide formyltransferase-1
MAKLRLVVLISGNGSNLQAIIDACRQGSLDAEIAAVISNKPDAYGLQRARQAGITYEVLDHTQFDNREAFDQALMQRIDTYQPGLVVLAGFMRILSSQFVEHYLGHMLNIHPSLLPKYQGLNTHRRALEAGDKVHGASVHFVTADLDSGQVVLQAEIPVLADDDEQSLAARVLEKEHEIYPQAIQWFAEGKLKLQPL